MSGEGEKPNFQGKYKLIKSENLDEFLSANGVNWIVRKMACSSSPTLEITQDGDKFSIKLVSLVRTKETNFTMGEEFEEDQPNGIVMKVLPSWDGNKIVMTYEPKVAGEGKPQKTTRELEGDELTMIMEIENVIAKRVFQRI